MTATTTISDKDKAVIYAEMAKAVTRYAGTVTNDRYKVDFLRFIVDRTFSFQKLSEVIPIRHFRDGVQSAAKGITCAGLKMSEAKLYDCIRWAREQGIVVTTKPKRKVRYAIKREWVLTLVPPKTREKIAPALTLTDEKWGTEEPREHLHAVEVSAPGYLHGMEVHLKNHTLSREEEKKSSARELAPDAGPGSSSFSAEEKRASAPVRYVPAVAPCPAVETAPPAPIQVVLAAPPNVKVAKRGRPARELWGSTLWDRFDAAFREAWPEASLPAEASIKLQAQWEFIATHWRRTDIGPSDWLEWCVKNWRTIYLTVFQHVEHTQEREAAWRAKAPSVRRRQWREDMVYPEYPDFDFLRKYRKAFEVEYGCRNSQMVRTDLLPGAKHLRRLLHKGWPLEYAQREVTKSLAERKFVEDLDERVRKLAKAEYRIQLKEQDIDNRIAIGRSFERPVRPVLPKRGLNPQFMHGDEMPPLPPLLLRPFKDHHDDPDEGPELAVGLVLGQPPSRDPVQAGGHS